MDTNHDAVGMAFPPHSGGTRKTGLAFRMSLSKPHFIRVDSCPFVVAFLGITVWWRSLENESGEDNRILIPAIGPSPKY